MEFSLKRIRKIYRKWGIDRGKNIENIVKDLASIGVEAVDLTVDNGIEQYYGKNGFTLVSAETPEKVFINTKANGAGVEFVIHDYQDGRINFVEYREKLGLLGIEWVRLDTASGIAQYHAVDKSIVYEHKISEKI